MSRNVMKHTLHKVGKLYLYGANLGEEVACVWVTLWWMCSGMLWCALVCSGYTLVDVLWYGLFARRPCLICVIPAHSGRCSERLISALEEANI